MVSFPSKEAEMFLVCAVVVSHGWSLLFIAGVRVSAVMGVSDLQSEILIGLSEADNPKRNLKCVTYIRTAISKMLNCSENKSSLISTSEKCN